MGFKFWLIAIVGLYFFETMGSLLEERIQRPSWPRGSVRLCVTIYGQSRRKWRLLRRIQSPRKSFPRHAQSAQNGVAQKSEAIARWLGKMLGKKIMLSGHINFAIWANGCCHIIISNISNREIKVFVLWIIIINMLHRKIMSNNNIQHVTQEDH